MEKRAYTRFSIGDRFGRLVIQAQDGKFAECRCDCGSNKRIAKFHLRSGVTSSCGCFHKQRASEGTTTHGKSKSGAFKTWLAMRDRCANPSNEKYAYYGGRGIAVCARWQDDFSAFYSDMGDRPTGMTIDRVDPDKDYEPGNCKWATAREQAKNQRPRRSWTVFGNTYASLTLAASDLGVSRQTVKNWCTGYRNDGRVLPARLGCESVKHDNKAGRF